MRHLWFFLFLFFASSMVYAETTGRGGLFFGEKSLDSKDWGALDSQSAWGINLDVKDTSWPVWITTGYISSRDKITAITSLSPFATEEIEGKTSEIRIGVKKDFSPIPIMRLSVAGGPAYMRASLDNSVAPLANDTDSAVGGWFGADIIFFFHYIAVGAGYSYSHANVDLFDQSVDAGGKNLSFTFGFGW